MSRVRRLSLAALALLFAALLLMAATPQGRTAYHTLLFISQVTPSLPRVTLLQGAPERSAVEVPTPEGVREADLYLPRGDGPFAAVALFLGVAPAGRDDPRVVNLAEGLARAGMAVLVYWSPEKAAERIHEPDAANLAAAHRFLREQPYTDPERVGLAGFCVGASFALMAAAHPDAQVHVSFVNAFGAYDDLERLLLAVATRSQPSPNGPTPWDPNDLTLRVAQRMMEESLEKERHRAQPADLARYESAVALLLAGTDAPSAERAIADLPPALRARMARVSPRNYLAEVRAPVLLMHDRADNLVPVGGSRRLYAALSERGDVRYTEFSLFQHVDPTRPLPLWEQARELAKLYRHMYAVLRQAS